MGCESQSLGESLAVVGTPYRLSYSSNRVAGRKDGYRLAFPISAGTVPTPLKRIDLQIFVAGRAITQSFGPAPNQQYTFTWDGKDAFGRVLVGKQPVRVRLGYVYPALLESPAQSANAFGAVSGVVTANGNEATTTEITVWTELDTQLGGWDARAAGLGSWTLDVHHAYDLAGQLLYRGDGRRQPGGALSVVDTVAGGGSSGHLGDGGPATQASLGAPTGVALGPDGNLYISEDIGFRIRRVGADGVITTVVGTGTICVTAAPCDDGLPATQARIANPNAVAIGPDGSIYFTENNNWTNRVRKVGPDGLIRTVAGAGTGGDGGPAATAQLLNPTGLAVGPDGSVYIAENSNKRVRRVDAAGIISTLAGNGVDCNSSSTCGDGGPAALAQLTSPYGVAVGPDGSVYITDSGGYRVRRVGPDGIIHTVAGGGNPPDGLGDGLPATSAAVFDPQGIAVGRDGSLFIVAYGRVRLVAPDGIIRTVAGGTACLSAPCGDGGPAPMAGFIVPVGAAVGPDGNFYVADENAGRIRGFRLPGLDTLMGDLVIPSDDGRQLYVFDQHGLHLRTLSALTGATRYSFAYDGAGRLAHVTDGDGNVTAIQRDASGNPTAIVGPYGQITMLTLDGHAYLGSVTDPAGAVTHMSYSVDGLLTSLSDPRGNTSTFTYDSLGRLAKDQNAAGGFWALTRLDSPRAFSVTLTSALSRTTTYAVQGLPTGDRLHQTTEPDGGLSLTQRDTDGVITATLAEGTRLMLSQAPDPRLGMLAPVPALATLANPSGLSYTRAETRTATLSNPLDVLSLTRLTDAVAINGRSSLSIYSAATRQFTQTTPLGRQTFLNVDALGRTLQAQLAGLLPTSIGYDGHGRLATITQGSGPGARTTSLSYDSSGNLASVTDPLGRTQQATYDAAGRVISQTLPGGQVIGYAYDADGNLTALTPPGRPAHMFSYTPLNQVAAYTPPDVGAGSAPTQYAYNLDRQLSQIAQPGGQTLNLTYDQAGRLRTESLARGQIVYDYAPASGLPLTITAPGGITLTYGYDGALLTRETWAGPVTGSVTRTLDNNLQITGLGIDGGAIAFGFDADGLPTQAGDLTLSRDPNNGLLTGTALGPMTDSIRYDGFAGLVSYTAAFNGSSLFAQQFTRDGLGRIVTETETISGSTDVFAYSYDLSGRLAGVRQNGAALATYAYDSNGNRLSINMPAGVITASYDVQDRLVQYGTAAYGYAASGQLLTKTNGITLTTYQYDVLGNLLHVALPGGQQIDYLVDGQNRRIGKKVNGLLAQGLLYAQSANPVAQLDGNSALVSRFIYGTSPNVPDYMVSGGVRYRLVADHLGSVRLVVNVQTGAIVQRLDYDPFGRVLTDTNPGFQPFGFAGGLYDPDTGLVRFGLRDYDPQVGRWTTKDPIGLQGAETNLYAYVQNDPVNAVDPAGTDPTIRPVYDPPSRPWYWPLLRPLNWLGMQWAKIALWCNPNLYDVTTNSYGTGLRGG